MIKTDKAIARATSRKLLLIPEPTKAPVKKFEVDDDPQPATEKRPKYSWHMILNHGSSEVLTPMARNPYINEPSLDGIKSKNDMTYRACL